MSNPLKSSFLRRFVAGFALGAVLLAGTQIVSEAVAEPIGTDTLSH